MQQAVTKKRNETQLARARRPRRGFHRPAGLPPGILTPKSQKLFLFIDEYVKTGNVLQSAKTVGYSDSWAKSNAYNEIKRYDTYISYLQKLVVEQRVRILAIDTQSVLDEIARIGMVNEFDYIVVETDPKTQQKSVRRKHLHELSRDEMAAVKIVRLPNGTLTYDLRDKDPMLLALGKNLGLFNEKLIIERRNSSLSAKMDLSKVPTDQLMQIIKSFETVVVDSGIGRIIEAQ